MPRNFHILNGFTGGEISPDTWGRTETDQWPMMVEKMENVFSSPKGGAVRRGGLHFVLPTKFPTRNSRLIPFVFSREQSYILEFGHKYVRFFRDKGYVEDIANIRQYIGDNTSTLFMYPFPAIASGDISVFVNGELQTETTDYTIALADNVNNQIADFSDAASWDTNANSADDPWVLDGPNNRATSPANSEPVLEQDDVNLPRGAVVRTSFEFESFDYTLTAETATSNADVDIEDDQPPATVVAGTLTADRKNFQRVRYDLTLEDTANNSDFQWYVIVDGNIITSGEEENVSAATRITDSFIIPPIDLPADATYEIRVSASYSNAQSSPLVAGSQQATVLSVDYEINPDADLNFKSINPSDREDVANITPVVGEWSIEREVTNSFPLGLDFQTDPGLEVTIANPQSIIQTEGWVVTFLTPPANTDRVTILPTAEVPDSVLKEGNWVHRPDLQNDIVDIYEIESPFEEDELEELHFAQANDVMIFALDSQKPWRLTRYSPYDWRFEQPTFTGAPWEDTEYSPLEGYPRTVAFFQERLYFGGTVALPQTLWGSRAADFYDFDVPDTGGGEGEVLAPDDPVEYTIAAYTHEAIEWLSSERVLIIGTSATEHRLAPDQYIATDRLPTVSRMSAYGGAHVQPAYMGNLTVFVQTAGNQVRTFEQSMQTIVEKWDSIELDWMASHLTQNKVKQLGYSLNPNSILFMVGLNGEMFTMTYEPHVGEQQQVGWSRQVTDGLFKSLAVIPEFNRDEIWAIVERNIELEESNQEEQPETPYRYVEFFDTDVFTDSTLTYPPEDDPVLYPPLQEIAGLDHLEGKTVVIKVDGATHPDLVVNDGRIELNDEYQNIQVGLRYTPLIKLQRFASVRDPAQLQGQQGRWVDVFLRMVESAHPLVDGIRTQERHPDTPMGTPEPLVTDDVRVFNVGFDRMKQLTIEQDLPLPLHITSIFGVFESHGG